MLILRDGVNYKHHLKGETVFHKTEDYLIRLINQVVNHKDLVEKLKKMELSGSKINSKIN